MKTEQQTWQHLRCWLGEKSNTSYRKRWPRRDSQSQRSCYCLTSILLVWASWVCPNCWKSQRLCLHHRGCWSFCQWWCLVLPLELAPSLFESEVWHWSSSWGSFRTPRGPFCWLRVWPSRTQLGSFWRTHLRSRRVVSWVEHFRQWVQHSLHWWPCSRLLVPLSWLLDRLDGIAFSA